MALKKSELYSSLWQSCDELRGGMDASQYKDYVLVLLFQKYISGLPANLFYGTGIPACIIVIDKEQAQARKGIFMIDASKAFIKDGRKNRLRAQVDAFTRLKEIPRYSRMVPVSEISEPKNDFNLNLPRYWQVIPAVRAALFRKSKHRGYCELTSADVKATIYYVDTGVPVIRGQNMGSAFVSGEFVFVSDRKARSLSANLARADDPVFTQRGTLGQVSLVPHGDSDQYLISQSQMKVSLDHSRHDPHFVHHCDQSSQGQKQIVTSAIQTGVPHTNLGILRSYHFPAPPLPEQTAIAAVLTDMDAELAVLEQRQAKTRALKQGMMQELLTGRTRLV